MMNKSIKTKKMKFRIAVTTVRRQSGVHTLSDNLHCQEALVFRKSKPSQKYCLEIAKQIATLKFQTVVLSG